MDIRHPENYMLITRTECLAAEGADSCGKGGAGRPRRHEEAQLSPRGKQPPAAKRHGPFLPPSLSIKRRERNGYLPIKIPTCSSPAQSALQRRGLTPAEKEEQ